VVSLRFQDIGGGVYGLAKHIQQNKGLGESEDIYKTIFENLPFVAFTLDRKGRVLEANKCAGQTFGMRIEDVRGNSFSDVVTLGKKDLIKAFAEFRKNLGGKVTDKTVYKVKLKDDREIILELVGIPLKGRGEVTKVLDVGSDITDQREIERQFKMLFQKMPDAVIVLGRRGILLEASEESERLSGYRREEMLGKNIFKTDILDFKNKAIALKHFVHFSSGTKPSSTFELKIRRKDGAEILLEVKTHVIDYMGKKAAMIVLRDISDRETAEKALRESEKRLQDILMSSADWIWEIDKNGKYTFASGRVKEILGYESGEIIGKLPFDLMEEREAKKIGEIFQKITSEKKPIVDLEHWNISKDGRRVCLLTNGVPVADNKGNLMGYRGVDKDITGRKIKEEELRRRTEELEKFSRLGVGRELKMVELKKRVRELEEQLKGKPE